MHHVRSHSAAVVERILMVDDQPAPRCPAPRRPSPRRDRLPVCGLRLR